MENRKERTYSPKPAGLRKLPFLIVIGLLLALMVASASAKRNPADKLPDEAITTDMIADGAVTPEKLSEPLLLTICDLYIYEGLPLPDLCTKTVFATSSLHTGNLGGIEGANAICQAKADDAGLEGEYKAWISDATSSPALTFSKSAIPYVTVNGSMVAEDWDDLIDGEIMNLINVNELGYEYPGGSKMEVWTATDDDGTLMDDSGIYDCQAWTNESQDFQGEVGCFEFTDSLWTACYTVFPCSTNNHLYCFEQ